MLDVPNPPGNPAPLVKTSTKVVVIVLAGLGFLMLLCALMNAVLLIPLAVATQQAEAGIAMETLSGLLMTVYAFIPGIAVVIASLGVWLFFWRKIDEETQYLSTGIPDKEPQQSITSNTPFSKAGSIFNHTVSALGKRLFFWRKREEETLSLLMSTSDVKMLQSMSSSTPLPVGSAVSNNTVTPGLTGSKGAAFVTFLLLALLGLFWFGIALFQFGLSFSGLASTSSSLVFLGLWIIVSVIHLLVIREVLKRRTTAVNYLNYLTTMCLILGTISLASEAILQIIVISPYILLGILTFTNKKYYNVPKPGSILLSDSAIQEKTEAVLANPDLAAPYINRGVIYVFLNQYLDASYDFDKAISIEPNSPIAHFNRGLLLALESEYDRALPDLCQAIDLDSSFAPAWYMRGKIYADTNDADKAITDLEKALTLDLKPDLRKRTETLIMRIKKSGR